MFQKSDLESLELAILNFFYLFSEKLRLLEPLNSFLE